MPLACQAGTANECIKRGWGSRCPHAPGPLIMPAVSGATVTDSPTFRVTQGTSRPRSAGSTTFRPGGNP
jgi:hypothetical protein